MAIELPGSVEKRTPLPSDLWIPCFQVVLRPLRFDVTCQGSKHQCVIKIPIIRVGSRTGAPPTEAAAAARPVQ